MSRYVNPAAFQVLNGGTCATGTATPYHSTTEQAYYVCNGPEDYVPGTAGRVAPISGLYTQPTYNVDMGIKRTFPIYREWKLAFGVDMTNVTNHVVLAGPGSLSVSQHRSNRRQLRRCLQDCQLPARCPGFPAHQLVNINPRLEQYFKAHSHSIQPEGLGNQPLSSHQSPLAPIDQIQNDGPQLPRPVAAQTAVARIRCLPDPRTRRGTNPTTIAR